MNVCQFLLLSAAIICGLLFAGIAVFISTPPPPDFFVVAAAPEQHFNRGRRGLLLLPRPGKGPLRLRDSRHAADFKGKVRRLEACLLRTEGAARLLTRLWLSCGFMVIRLRFVKLSSSFRESSIEGNNISMRVRACVAGDRITSDRERSAVRLTLSFSCETKCSLVEKGSHYFYCPNYFHNLTFYMSN